MLVEKNNIYSARCDYCIAIKNNLSSNNPFVIDDICKIINGYLPIMGSVVSYTNIYNVSIRMCQEHYLYEKLKRTNNILNKTTYNKCNN